MNFDFKTIKMKTPFLSLLICAITAIFFQGCSSESPVSKPFKWEILNGRKEGEFTMPIYRVKVPIDWTRRNDLPPAEANDTTMALAEFFIHDLNHSIKITIHNFPTDNIEQRIAPNFQIKRWEGQFQTINPEQINITPQAFSGFSGLFFQGTGLMDHQPTTVLGWSMQIAPSHYQSLLYPSSEKDYQYRQMRSDFTIKVIGPADLVQKHFRSLTSFARSFELIEEIPSR